MQFGKSKKQPSNTSLLIALIAAGLLYGAASWWAGSGESQPPEPPTAKAPDISIHKAAEEGNIEAVKKYLAAGADVNAKTNDGRTPLDWAEDEPEPADLLRKHGGKTGEELKAAGN